MSPTDPILTPEVRDALKAFAVAVVAERLAYDTMWHACGCGRDSSVEQAVFSAARTARNAAHESAVNAIHAEVRRQKDAAKATTPTEGTP